MNVLIIISMLAGSGAIPVSPMAQELSRVSFLVVEGIEDSEEVRLGSYNGMDASWEASVFINNHNIGKTSEHWVVREGEIFLEVSWHATSKVNYQLLTYPPRTPEPVHFVWREYYGIVEGDFVLVETVIGEYIPAEEATIEWPEE